MQGLFDQDASLKVALLTCWYIYDFARTRVPGSWLGFGVLHSENTESSYLNPVALDKALPHRLKEGIDNLLGQLLFNAQFLRNS